MLLPQLALPAGAGVIPRTALRGRVRAGAFTVCGVPGHAVERRRSTARTGVDGCRQVQVDRAAITLRRGVPALVKPVLVGVAVMNLDAAMEPLAACLLADEQDAAQ
ncbi:hypothetical protein [Peterkaempfera sp. SMS 1(5)a]|uniref:hypothetical protein n=1 Tax=Peterkaempfera podocarpi TaxID=3232308 RepID=UPI00366DF0D9